jgi:hypothetical protein
MMPDSELTIDAIPIAAVEGLALRKNDRLDLAVLRDAILNRRLD